MVVTEGHRSLCCMVHDRNLCQLMYFYTLCVDSYNVFKKLCSHLSGGSSPVVYVLSQTASIEVAGCCLVVHHAEDPAVRRNRDT